MSIVEQHWASVSWEWEMLYLCIVIQKEKSHTDLTDSTDSFSLQATVLYTSTLTVKKTCMSWASTFCTRCCSPSRFMLAAQSSCWDSFHPLQAFLMVLMVNARENDGAIAAGTLCYILLTRFWLHTFLHQHKGDETQEKGIGGLFLEAMGYDTW